jgi:hypothetical protein
VAKETTDANAFEMSVLVWRTNNPLRDTVDAGSSASTSNGEKEILHALKRGVSTWIKAIILFLKFM